MKYLGHVISQSGISPDKAKSRTFLYHRMSRPYASYYRRFVDVLSISYDRKAKEHKFKVGDRVMIHMPSAVTGKAWKLAITFHGPYRVLDVTPTNIEAKLVDDSDSDSIFVAVDLVTLEFLDRM